VNLSPRLETPRRRALVDTHRTVHMSAIAIAAVLAGALAVGFAKLCDLSIDLHREFTAARPWIGPALLPVAFVVAAWLTRTVAPQAAGSGIPQVISAAEHPAPVGVDDPRLSWKTALVKALLCIGLLVCGASIGREGPTVQIASSAVVLMTARLRARGSDRRALVIAGGAAGVAAAFNTPIAGAVFAVEELAKGFDRRTNAVVILVVVAAGAASFALSGDYAYFGEMQSGHALKSAWLSAPIIGVVAGAAGGLFSRGLLSVIGPRAGVFGAFKKRRPLLLALGCGLISAVAAIASQGATYGTGYLETQHLLAGQSSYHAFSFGLWKWVANLAAAASGAPGGIFSPSLAAGAGIGAWIDSLLPFGSGRDAIILGMACYLSGVVQAPLTSAIILMEMTRDPGLVGPLMLGSLLARAVSARICRKPVYHALAEGVALP
jgi:H+/Cl- antiporter ClcA